SPTIVMGVGSAAIIDSLIITWPRKKEQVLTNIKADQQLFLKESDATASHNQKKNNIESILYPISHSPINYVHHQDEVNDFKRQSLLINPLSYVGPCMAKGDIDGDGKEDIFIGSGNGFPA